VALAVVVAAAGAVEAAALAAFSGGGGGTIDLSDMVDDGSICDVLTQAAFLIIRKRVHRPKKLPTRARRVSTDSRAEIVPSPAAKLGPRRPNNSIVTWLEMISVTVSIDQI
jgi:hypothetical protein